MKWLFGLVLIVFSGLAQAQSLSGTVVDSETGDPIPFAAIRINHENRGVSADGDGRFVLKSVESAEFLLVRAFGYRQKRVGIEPGIQTLEVELEVETTVLEDVQVVAGENPLHRIIRNVTANRSRNNPTNLDAFSYTSYSKMIFTLQEDSLGEDFDTVWVPVDTLDEAQQDSLRMAGADSVMKVDSSAYNARRFMERQHLFIMESATERKYVKPRDHEKVIATRVSGLKTPLFVLLSNEIQSFSFYDNYVSLLGAELVNPVAPGAIGRYVYLPEDTIISGRDTTYVIRFFPVRDARFNGMQGTLYITTDNWAVTRVIARRANIELASINGVEFGFEIEQVYEKLGGHWFPVELSLYFKRFGEGIIGIEPQGLGRTWLRNIEINPPLRRRDVERIAVAVDPNATERSDEFWNQYREDTLTAKERATYHYVDSIGEAMNIDQRIKWYMALSTGKINFGLVDLNINELLRINVYEGFRLGLGLETSDKLSEHFRVGGNIAYGFKDKVWKYGYFGKIMLDKYSEWQLFGGYSFDIFESAGTRFEMKRKSLLSNTNWRFLNVPVFDEVSEVYFGSEFNIWPTWKVRLSVHRQNRFTRTDYWYDYEPEGMLVNGFNIAKARVEMVYSPNDRHISGPFGLRPLKQTYPRFRLAYEESVDGFFDRNYPYRRLDLSVVHEFKRVYSGITRFTLAGSWLQGDVPYGLLSGPNANGGVALNSKEFLRQRILAGIYNFETMPFNTYAAQQYVMLDVRHNFENRLFGIGTWRPDVEVVYRGAFGGLRDAERHIGLTLTGIEHGYHETGLEVNSLWQGVGIGFYQRFGAYYTGTWSNNAIVKVTYRIQFPF